MEGSHGDSRQTSQSTYQVVREQRGFGPFLAYQACLNLSYIVRGLYSGEEHAALADGAAGALKRLVP